MAFIESQHHEDDVHLIREIMRAHQTVLAAFSPQVGMPASRLALIRLLALSGPAGMTISQIARQLGVNLAAVTRHVQYLESKDLVLRRGDPADRRRSCVRLSAKGIGVFNSAHQRSHELESSLARSVGLERMRMAAQVLAQVRQSLEAINRGAPQAQEEES
jgi:DNA-binding MarR family transcriptional regulator